MYPMTFYSPGNPSATSALPSLTRTAMLGLPPLPSSGRISLRRPPRQPPAISLPPLPKPATPATQGPIEQQPHIAINFANGIKSRYSVHSDMLPPDEVELRKSFDFTSEYAKLDHGDRRSSFVKALKKVASMQAVGQQSYLDLISASSAMLRHATRETETSALSYSETAATHAEYRTSEQLYMELNHESFPSSIQEIRPCRPDPFEGQLVFQQYTSRAKESNGRVISLSAPPCDIAYQASVHPRRRGHRRGESGLSIATMSSIGAVIETGIAGEYINHFEINFAEHLNRTWTTTGDSVDEVSDVCAAASSTGSLPWNTDGTKFASLWSCTQSDTEAELNSIGDCLSISKEDDSRQSSFISRHKLSGYTDNATGRADWAAYKRNVIGGNSASDLSTARLGRPGLGERMFHLDKTVKLESTVGSPSDEPVALSHKREWSYSSLLESSQAAHDGLLYPSYESNSDGRNRGMRATCSSLDSDCVFKDEYSAGERELFIKGVRTVSMTESSSSSSDDPDDTFINVARYAKRFTPANESEDKCLEGEGDNVFAMSRYTPHLPDLQLTHSGQAPLRHHRSITRPAASCLDHALLALQSRAPLIAGDPLISCIGSFQTVRQALPHPLPPRRLAACRLTSESRIRSRPLVRPAPVLLQRVIITRSLLLASSCTPRSARSHPPPPSDRARRPQDQL